MPYSCGLRFCFSNWLSFLFSANDSVFTFSKLMAPIAIMDHVGTIDIKLAGYAYIKESLVDVSYYIINPVAYTKTNNTTTL